MVRARSESRDGLAPEEDAEDKPPVEQGHHSPPDQPGGQQRLAGGRRRLKPSAPVAWLKGQWLRTMVSELNHVEPEHLQGRDGSSSPSQTALKPRIVIEHALTAAQRPGSCADSLHTATPPPGCSIEAKSSIGEQHVSGLPGHLGATATMRCRCRPGAGPGRN